MMGRNSFTLCFHQLLPCGSKSSVNMAFVEGQGFQMNREQKYSLLLENRGAPTDGL